VDPRVFACIFCGVDTSYSNTFQTSLYRVHPRKLGIISIECRIFSISMLTGLGQKIQTTGDAVNEHPAHALTL
jgi:hypothetical protein